MEYDGIDDMVTTSILFHNQRNIIISDNQEEFFKPDEGTADSAATGIL